MPDVISRIKLEAQGADQAAREIRKLRDAYDEVAVSSKGIGASVGGGDPFSKATSPPSSLPDTGGGPKSPAGRHQEDDRWQKQVNDRQQSNTLMGMTQGGMSTVEQVGAGQYGGAVGGALKGVGSLLGGGLGIGLAAAGFVAYGTQRLANNEYERVSRIWGGGQAQRLGLDYSNVRNWESNMARSGIPMEMIQSFSETASQSGFTANQEGASNAARMAMEAGASLGVNAGVTGNLLGALTRSGAGVTTADYEMYSRGRGAFGDANVGRYIQELTRSIETLSSQGIAVTPEGFTEKQGFLTGLGVFGGMTPDAAIATFGRLQSRGIEAGALSKPEDIIAYQAMRETGMSMTDTMAAMEKNPEQVNRAIYDYLRTSYGADSEELRLRFKNYAGGTMSSTIDTLKYFEETRDMTSKEIEDYTAEKGRYWMESGEYAPEERAHTAARQAEMLKALEETALDITTSLASLRSIFQGEITLSSIGITWRGEGPKFKDDKPDTWLPGDINAENVLIDNPEMITILNNLGSGLGIDTSGSTEAFLQGGATPAQRLGGYGDFDQLYIDQLEEIIREANKQAKGTPYARDVKRWGYETAMEMGDPDFKSRIVSDDQVINLLEQVVDELRLIMPIYTDGPAPSEGSESGIR